MNLKSNSDDNKRILIVEDEEKVARIVKSYLEIAGYQVKIVKDGESALKEINSFSPHFLILDLMLPGKSGEEVAQKVRAKSDIPILMLTAKSSEKDRIQGFRLGADDYVVKPFSPRELVARVEAILRRVKKKTQSPRNIVNLAGGRIIIEEDNHVVKVEGKRVDLTPTEYKILLAMARYPGRVFSRAELQDIISEYDYQGFDRTIDAHIKNLRRKLEQNPRRPSFIKTVWGFGYKLEDEGEET